MLDIIGTYKKMILSLIPENLIKNLSDESGTLRQGMINYALPGIIVTAFILLNMILTPGSTLPNMIISGIVLLIFIPILIVISNFITNGVMYLLAKLLGGKGTFEEHFYQFSILGGGVIIISILLSLFTSWLPAYIGIGLSLIFELYSFYLVFLVYKGVHKIDSTRAALMLLLPVLVAIGLAILLYPIVGPAITSLMQTSGAA